MSPELRWRIRLVILSAWGAEVPGLAEALRGCAEAVRALQEEKPVEHQLWVFAGDVLPAATSYEFAECCGARLELGYPSDSCVFVAGELELGLDKATRLVVQSLRAADPFMASVAAQEGVVWRRVAFERAVSRSENVIAEPGLFPPVHVWSISQDPDVDIVTCDTAILAIGDDTDRGRLVIGGDGLRRYFAERPADRPYIFISHHPLGWLAPSQEAILRSLKASLIIHGHATGSLSEALVVRDNWFVVAPHYVGPQMLILDATAALDTVELRSFRWHDVLATWKHVRTETGSRQQKGVTTVNGELRGWAKEEKPPTALRRIRIFLASSAELREDRDEFDRYFRQLNDQLLEEGVYLQVVRWENFLDAMSDTRLQDEYNKELRRCDIFVSLFFTKTGKYTEEEFDTAHRQFKDTGLPRIYTFFKDADIKTGSAREEDLNSLWAFQKKLRSLGHFYTMYNDIEHLKLLFRDQLDELLG